MNVRLRFAHGENHTELREGVPYKNQIGKRSETQKCKCIVPSLEHHLISHIPDDCIAIAKLEDPK